MNIYPFFKKIFIDEYKLYKIINYQLLNVYSMIILLKIILCLIINYFIVLQLYYNYCSNKLKVCLCTVGKLENKYIIEFIEHYKKYGIDKIFLYDNNEIKGERFDSLLYGYIRNNYVKIINYRGKIAKQLGIYQHCYKENYKNYDFLIFYDIDEFINLKNHKNIKTFLNLKRFKKCQSIYLNWIKHTDNNLIFYDNRSLFQRFPEKYMNKNYCLGKTIIKGNIKQIRMESTHVLDSKLIICDGFGHIFKPIKTIFCKNIDLNINYIDHYEYKSTEEFINKINKGDCLFGFNIKNKLERIKRYFRFNKITLKKINFIAQKTGINTSIIKETIKKIKY